MLVYLNAAMTGLRVAVQGSDGGAVALIAADCAADVLLAPQGGTDARNRVKRLASIHCGRRHVLSASNSFGVIGSAPSSPATRICPDCLLLLGISGPIIRIDPLSR